MVRFKIGVSYIGTPYAGFTKALDSRLPSVQERLEMALRSFLSGSETGTTNSDMGDRAGTFKNFQVSSRTDAGVHAIRNVFHVDCFRMNGTHDYTSEGLVDGLNFYLGKQYRKGKYIEMDDEIDSEFETIRQSYRNKSVLRSIVISDAKAMPDSFDARVDALARTYDYHIIAPSVSSFNRRRKALRGSDGTVYSQDSLIDERFLFNQHRMWCLPHPVHVGAMREGANYLVGVHDFSTFRNSGCQSQSPIRHIHSIQVSSKLSTGADLGLWPYLALPSPASFTSASSWQQYEEYCDNIELITVSIKADSFLLRMVRNIVGALVHVGRGRGENCHDMSTMLEWRNRHMLKIKPAPAEGLYLRDVHY